MEANEVAGAAAPWYSDIKDGLTIGSLAAGALLVIFREKAMELLKRVLFGNSERIAEIEKMADALQLQVQLLQSEVTELREHREEWREELKAMGELHRATENRIAENEKAHAAAVATQEAHQGETIRAIKGLSDSIGELIKRFDVHLQQHSGLRGAV